MQAVVARPNILAAAWFWLLVGFISAFSLSSQNCSAGTVYVNCNAKSQEPDGKSAASGFRRIDRAYKAVHAGDRLVLVPCDNYPVLNGFRFDKPGQIVSEGGSVRVSVQAPSPSCPTTITPSFVNDKIEVCGDLTPKTLKLIVQTDTPGQLNYEWRAVSKSGLYQPVIVAHPTEPGVVDVSVTDFDTYTVSATVSCGNVTSHATALIIVNLPPCVTIIPPCPVQVILPSELRRVINETAALSPTVNNICDATLQYVWEIDPSSDESGIQFDSKAILNPQITITKLGRYKLTLVVKYRDSGNQALTSTSASTTLIATPSSGIIVTIVQPSQSIRVCPPEGGIIIWPKPTIGSVTLEAQVREDGALVGPNTLPGTWSCTRRPNDSYVAIAQPAGRKAVASVTDCGDYEFVYTIREASGDAATGLAVVSVVCDCPPLVSAGRNPSPVDVPDPVILEGSVQLKSDRPVAIQWKTIAAPAQGQVDFQPSDAARTRATFSRAGIYEVALQATGAGQASVQDTIKIEAREAIDYIMNICDGSCAAIPLTCALTLKNTHPRRLINAVVSWETKDPVYGLRLHPAALYPLNHGEKVYYECQGGGTVVQNINISASFSAAPVAAVELDETQRLTFYIHDNAMFFSWPETEPAMILEAAGALDDDTLWHRVPEDGPADDPFLYDGLHSANVPIDSAAMFFRLNVP